MEKNNFKNITTYALFYGSLWGITEATLGYVLHTMPVLISGSIMFPIAMFFMLKAYQGSKSNSVFLLMGLTAALIKLVDIFIPGLPVIKTINPMIAIMLEASAVTVFAFLLNSNKIRSIFIGSLGACFFWRILFVMNSFVITNTTSATVGWVNSSEKVISFILINGIISTFIAFAVILMEKNIKFSINAKMIMRPSYAIGLFISASFIQYFL